MKSASNLIAARLCALAIMAVGARSACGLPASAATSPPAPASQAFSQDDIKSHDAANKAYTARVVANGVKGLMPAAGINQVIVYGQSLSVGSLSHPPLSTTPVSGNYMLGRSVRPSTFVNQNYAPVARTSCPEYQNAQCIAGGALCPLIATVHQVPASADEQPALLCQDQIRNIPSNPPAPPSPQYSWWGETVAEGALKLFRTSWLAQMRQAPPAGFKAGNYLFVASVAGRSGRSIAQLSKSATPNFYGRIINAAQQARDIAVSGQATPNASYALTALIHMQGEDDYSVKTSKDTFKRLTRQLFDDVHADAPASTLASPGSAPPLPVFTYQTGGSWTSTDPTLPIGMAQWEMSEPLSMGPATQSSSSRVFLVGPIYPYPDHSHLYANGTRWFAKRVGKVMERVLLKGEGWEPLSPIKATLRDREILVDFHVPVPPLKFDFPLTYKDPSGAQIGQSFLDRGFTVLQGNAVLTIDNLYLDGSLSGTTVRIVLKQTPTGNTPLSLNYADNVSGATVTGYRSPIHRGDGNLRDSDNFNPAESYRYLQSAGADPEENIVAAPADNIPTTLVDKPYKMYNWCIAFHIPIDQG